MRSETVAVTAGIPMPVAVSVPVTMPRVATPEAVKVIGALAAPAAMLADTAVTPVASGSGANETLTGPVKGTARTMVTLTMVLFVRSSRAGIIGVWIATLPTGTGGAGLGLTVKVDDEV